MKYEKLPLWLRFRQRPYFLPLIIGIALNVTIAVIAFAIFSTHSYPSHTDASVWSSVLTGT